MIAVHTPTFGEIADSSNTTISISYDAPTASGDIVLLYAVSGGRTYSVPAGFTLLANQDGGNVDGYVFARECEAGETGVTLSVSLTFSGGTALAVRISGATLVGEDSPAPLFGNGSNGSSPGVTTPDDSSLVVWLGSVQEGAATFDAPAGVDGSSNFTPIAGGNYKVGVAWEIAASAGAVTGKAWTHSFINWCHGAVAIGPASSGPSVSIPALYRVVNRR